MKHDLPNVFAKAVPLAQVVTPSRKAADILRMMRRVLDRPEQWLKGEYRSKDIDEFRVCVIGAFHLSQGSDTAENLIAYHTLLSCSPYNGYHNHKRITRWNDAPERTHQDVIRLLDKAIKREDRKAARGE